MFGHALTLVFLVAASLNSIVTLFFLCRIAKMVYQSRPIQKGKLSILSDAPRMIRAHQLLRRHGQELCKTNEPRCPRCPLAARCPGRV